MTVTKHNIENTVGWFSIVIIYALGDIVLYYTLVIYSSMSWFYDLRDKVYIITAEIWE
jgi:hypothetical protein